MARLFVCDCYSDILCKIWKVFCIVCSEIINTVFQHQLQFPKLMLDPNFLHWALLLSSLTDWSTFDWQMIYSQTDEFHLYLCVPGSFLTKVIFMRFDQVQQWRFYNLLHCPLLPCLLWLTDQFCLQFVLKRMWHTSTAMAFVGESQDCPPQDWLPGGQSWGGQSWPLSVIRIAHLNYNTIFHPVYCSAFLGGGLKNAQTHT